MHVTSAPLPPPLPLPCPRCPHTPTSWPCRMGGSLRRHKKSKPRIIKRQKKKKFVKSGVPQDLVHNKQEIEEKLGVE